MNITNITTLPLRLRRPFQMPPTGSAAGRAFELFQTIATTHEVEQLLQYGFVTVQGKYARYVATPTGGSGVIDAAGELLAMGCFVISDGHYGYGDGVVYPPMDHFVANYLMFKCPRGERIYWGMACFSPIIYHGDFSDLLRQMQRLAPEPQE